MGIRASAYCSPADAFVTDFTLALDGSTYNGSIALLRGVEVAAERTITDAGMPAKGGRAETVLPMVAECLTECGIAARDVTRVVCGSGPGSFTSLRITASIAKGLAVGAGCRLYAVSSLVLNVAGVRPRLGEGRYLSVLPAMRGECFVADVAVNANGDVEESSPVSIVTEDAVRERIRGGILTVGPGHGIDVSPHARGVALLLTDIVEGAEVDLATWEPLYGRLAEAQVKWEAAHGKALSAGG